MNKKAFTLIELLTVIVILAALMAIVVISVTRYINDTSEVSYKELVKSIETATELYLTDHAADYPELDIPGSTFTIELSDLANDNYIPDSLVDERTGDSIPMSTTVTIEVISKDNVSITLDWE